MIQVPDDYIIRCMERTGYPPWMEDEEEPEDDESPICDPYAVYDPA